MSTRKIGGCDLTALQETVSPFSLVLSCQRRINVTHTAFFFCFVFNMLSEGKYELEKCSRGFTLLPREFIGSVLDKVMNGCLGNKGWPHGAITVGEAGAEYSFLGGEAISRCCKYKGFTMHGWLDRHISRELYAGAT